MAYSSGKYAFFISDRSGMRFPYKERIKEWNGSIVHISEYEAKHEQLDPHRTVIEPSHGRSTSDTVRFRKALGFDGFSATVLTQSAGYSITKVDDNTYTFTASSGTATIGSQRGGGDNATAGAVTLEV